MYSELQIPALRQGQVFQLKVHRELERLPRGQGQAFQQVSAAPMEYVRRPRQGTPVERCSNAAREAGAVQLHRGVPVKDLRKLLLRAAAVEVHRL